MAPWNEIAPDTCIDCRYCGDIRIPVKGHVDVETCLCLYRPMCLGDTQVEPVGMFDNTCGLFEQEEMG